MESATRGNCAKALALLILCAISFSNIAFGSSPQFYSSADYYVFDAQSVTVLGGQMSQLNVTHSIPAGGILESAPKGSSFVKDEYGNGYVSIFIGEPPVPYTYHINTSVSEKKASITSLPQSFAAPDHINDYLSSDPLAQASSPRIRALAQKITENATGRFEQAALLAIWVHNRISYDASLVGREVSAEKILDDSRGVCTEYTTLYVSLARSIGIPARYVSGYAYSDMFGSWLGHSWAEVYLGQWVGVDPTWLEVGDIDATHIPSVKKPVLGFSTSSVTAMVYPPSAQLAFDQAAGSGGLKADNIHLMSSEISAPSADFSLSASSSRIPAGGKFLAYLAVPSGEYRVIGLSMLPCKGQFHLVDLDGQDRYIISEPGKTKYAVWEGTASSGLPENYRFTCPVTLNSPYFDPSSVSINITTADNPDWPTLDASLENRFPGVGSMQAAHVKFNPMLSGRTISLLTGDELIQKPLDSNSGITFAFPAGKPGGHVAYVFAPSGDPVRLEYEVSRDTGYSLYIEGLQWAAFAGDENKISASAFAPDGAKPAKASVEIEWDGQRETSEQFDISSGKNSLSIPFTPRTSGSHLLVLRLVSSGNELASSSKLAAILPPPRASVYRLSAPDGNGRRSVTFSVISGENVSGLSLGVGGREVPVDGEYVSMSLAPGNYTGALSWQSQNGIHSVPFNFTVEPVPKQDWQPALPPLPGIMPSQESAKSGPDAAQPSSPPSASAPPAGGSSPLLPILICPVALLLVFVPIALMVRSRKKPSQPPQTPLPPISNGAL